MEIPILYKETNTEAIRTLIFMKTVKGKQPDSLDKKISAGKTLLKDVNASLLGLQDSTEKSDALEEKEEIKKRREDTQKKMDEIEKLFMKLNEEDNIRTDSIPAGEKK
jgi:glutamine synthetase type III